MTVRRLARGQDVQLHRLEDRMGLRRTGTDRGQSGQTDSFRERPQIRIVTGFSIRRTNAAIHSAATAPSMTR